MNQKIAKNDCAVLLIGAIFANYDANVTRNVVCLWKDNDAKSRRNIAVSWVQNH